MTGFTVDIIIAVVALGLVATGWQHGFIRTLGSLVGLVVSLAVALYGSIWIQDTFGFNFFERPITGLVLFLVLAMIASHLAGWIVGVLDLARRVVSIIPFVGLVNSIGGALVGGVEAAATLGVFAFVAVEYLPDSALKTAALASRGVGAALDVLYRFGLL